MSAVFFDIGDTLGTVKVSSPPIRITGLDVFDHVPPILASLKQREIPLGIISNTGNEPEDRIIGVLRDANIWRFFDRNLVLFSSVVGLEKNSPEIFQLAAGRAGARSNPDTCVFVGEDSRERQFAKQAGFRVAAHAQLVNDVLAGQAMQFLRVQPAHDQTAGWREVLDESSVVTYPPVGSRNALFAQGSPRAAAELDDLGFLVDRLGSPGAPDTTDLYLQRDDRQTRTGFLAAEGQASQLFGQSGLASSVLASISEGLILALPSVQSIEDVHFLEAQHGHTIKLIPDRGPLQALDDRRQLAAWTELAVSEPELSTEEVDLLTNTVSEENVARWHCKYAGHSPLHDDDVTISSRHIRHPDNRRAVEALAVDLEQIGNGDLAVQFHTFTHEGRMLLNVEAALTGSRPGMEVVLSAHLDSTASFNDSPFNPLTDPAPGADDDASGVAAVLVAAEAAMQLKQLRPLRHTLRFVLFNAEEQGLVGSQHYARARFLAGADIAAVYQIDMIGHSGTNQAPYPFEVHAGFPGSAAVQMRSRLLAERLQRVVSKVSPNLESPQIYTTPDPAAGRSDHASFQQRGYAACIASEDFFVGPLPTSPAPQANPHYHKSSDDKVNNAYMAEIARAVTAAAWITANRE